MTQQYITNKPIKKMGQRPWQTAHQRYKDAKSIWWYAPHLISSGKWKLKL